MAAAFVFVHFGGYRSAYLTVIREFRLLPKQRQAHKGSECVCLNGSELAIPQRGTVVGAAVWSTALISATFSYSGSA